MLPVYTQTLVCTPRGYYVLSHAPYVCTEVSVSPDVVAESEEHWSRVREGDHGFKPMTYKINTCRFLARYSALLGYGKDWLAQCQDNVTE